MISLDIKRLLFQGDPVHNPFSTFQGTLASPRTPCRMEGEESDRNKELNCCTFELNSKR
jgi:hypothetical protein